MLVNFNVFNDLNSHDTTVRLGACTANTTDSVVKRSTFSHSPRASYNNDTETANTTISSWLTSTTDVVDLEILSTGSNGATLNSGVVSAATALRNQLQTESQTLSVAYSDGAAVGVFAGERIDSTSTDELLQRLIDTFSNSSTADVVVMQICGQERSARGVLGVIAYADSTTVDLGTVQSALASWNKAECVTLDGASESVESITLYQTPLTTPSSTKKARGTPTGLEARATSSGDCTAIQVGYGDYCDVLTAECGITSAEFYSYNTASDLCSTLAVGQWVCCTAGTLPDLSPSAYDNGTCYTYYVASGDTCSALAAAWTLTVDEIEEFNENTWGWMGCDDLLADMNICLSDGDAPMPASISNAECGPQVPGTEAPDSDEDLADLNPCTLNACCDVWGQCGVTAEFCTISNSTTGAPGTAAAGDNGCISNCGTEITNNKLPPDEFFKIGYFMGSNWNRPCLNLEASDIPSDYTHVHFGFANLTEDFDVVISDDQLFQWEIFLGMTTYKRIVSIGGWAFSTDPSTYHIFREGTTDDNRATLIANVVAFVNDNGLDGVDFDWEYPGEPDIDGIPAGGDDEGLNYLNTLIDLREALDDDKSLSFAAPASYWYLKQFLIQEMSEVVSYIVYMTYDLHGQWDYESTYAAEGCSSGSCLRSHVNLTETHTALAMITKAGVEAESIAVGVSSYGRSFRMSDSSCTGPDCTFTGPDSGAEAGICTNTSGYISNMEIQSIIDNSSISSTSTLDEESYSNIVTWDDNWVAYMDDDNKAVRIEVYQALNFLGTSDWAIDLQDIDGSTGLELTLDLTGHAVSASSNQICGLTYTTSDDTTTIEEAGAIVSNTWDVSGAGDYLDEGLQTNGTAAWMLTFFETTVGCGDTPGGSVFDCTDIEVSTCDAPRECSTYCPREAFFIHQSIHLFFTLYKRFHERIIDYALVTSLKSLDEIADAFAAPDGELDALYSILGGALTTLAGVGVFVGDFGLDTLGAASDGLAAFAAIFADTALSTDEDEDTSGELGELLGTAIVSVFSAINATVNSILDPPAGADISKIETAFQNGAFLDSRIVDWAIDAIYHGFTNTMDAQDAYLVLASMQAGSSSGGYSQGYAFVYGEDEYTSEDDCNDIGNGVMIWYDDMCIGFGTYENVIFSGQNGYELSYVEVWDNDDDALAVFLDKVHSVEEAIISNYNCWKNPTDSGSAEFPTSFDPSNPVVYPDCFFNLEAMSIKSP
ncbi:hypothetical protein E8E14_011938 [Neopestalotiopsis sp. 37M]|nr:hypothetical protein E8E14_011938 [Neopestalotiopsis sp. 37M]